jgi:hypothetical protein
VFLEMIFTIEVHLISYLHVVVMAGSSQHIVQV